MDQSAYSSLLAEMKARIEQHLNRLEALAHEAPLEEIRREAGYLRACRDLKAEAERIIRQASLES